MSLEIIQQELGPTHVILLSLSPSAAYLATPHICLQRIGCKHMPSYFACPIVGYRRAHDKLVSLISLHVIRNFVIFSYLFLPISLSFYL